LAGWPGRQCRSSGARRYFGTKRIDRSRRSGQIEHRLVFGNAAPAKSALRVTFDGWIAKVGPARDVTRLPEREYCSLAGVLAASLALSELFLCFDEISVEATRRVVAISLWRPIWMPPIRRH
jgi:hypothetical protein